MNQVRRKSSFWRLAGPLLAYLGIQWVVQTLAQTVISFPYIMRAYMDAIQSGTRDLSEIYMNALEPAVEAMLKYQVEIMDEQFNLSYIEIRTGGADYRADFDYAH